VAAREIEELLAAHFDAALDDAGAERLEALLAADEDSSVRLAALARVEGLLRARAADRDRAEALTSRVMKAVRREGSRRRFTREVMDDLPRPRLRRSRLVPGLLAAAALLVMVTGGGWLLLRSEPAGVISAAGNPGLVGTKLAYGETLRTRAGEEITLALSDGSRLVLGPGSAAEIPRRREIRLGAGEARLTCESDADNPFSVFASDTEARAVGTEFSVGIEEEEKVKHTVIVTVFSGLVLVTNPWGHLRAGEGQEVASSPGAAPSLLAPAKKKPKSPKPPKAEGDLAKELNLEFTAQPLGEACNFVAGLVNFKLTCDDELAKKKLNLRMSKTPSVSVIRWMALLAGAKAWQLPDGTVVISTEKPKGARELLYVVDDSEEWKKEIEKKLTKKVNFEFVQAPLSECVNFFQQVSEVNMVLDPAVAKKAQAPVTLKMTGATLKLALTWILRMARLEYHLVDRAVFITKAGKPAAGGAGEPSEKLAKVLAKKVSVEFEARPLEECINFVRGLTDAKIVVDPKAFDAGGVDPKTPVTAKLEQLPLKVVLEKLTALVGMRLEYHKGDVIYLTAGKKAAKPPVKPEVF
jgi:ferric-dicitrate binding protein FerR (iron transport regulator)